jgi:hypothetical protein
LPVDLIYLDEQMGVGPRGKYTACIAAIISSDQLHDFRKKFYLEAARTLGAFEETDHGRSVGRVPILHGSDLLRDYDDSTKIEMMDLLLSEFTQHGGVFARVGYYDASNLYRGTQLQNIGMAVNSFRLTFSKRDLPFCFIHEADQSSLAKDHPSYQSPMISMYYQFGEENISFDLKNFIGDFVTQKHDLGCQVADISGYIAMKRHVGESTFAKSLQRLHGKYSQYYIFDELIWWNEGKD